MRFLILARLYLVGVFVFSCFYLQKGLAYILGHLSGGVSSIRAGSLLFFVVSAILALVFLLSTWVAREKFQNIVSRAGAIFERKTTAKRYIYLLIAISLVGYFLIFLERVPDNLAQLHFHLLPLVEFVSINTFWLLVLVGVFNFDWSRLRLYRHYFMVSLIVAGGVILLLLPIMIFKTGLSPIYGWGPPGTPVLLWQALASVAVGFSFLWLKGKKGTLPRFLNQNAVIFILLWVVSAFLWSQVPVQSDHFITDKLPPNSEFYPYSDSATYDLSSQELLIGNGFSSASASKPMYALFLAILHLFVGQEYEQVAGLQSILMGVIPSLLFLLVSRLGGRPAGIAAALLVIFREYNSLTLTKIIRVSHTKMLMTESMTIIIMIILTTLVVYWLEEKKSRSPILLMIGGVLGASILLRGQILVLVPVVILIIVSQTYKDWGGTWKSVILVLLGFSLILIPWLARGYLTRGSVSIKESLPREWMLATRYSLTPEIRLEPPQGVNLDEYNRDMRSRVIEFVKEHPGVIANFVTVLFLHNQISSIVYLPMSFSVGSPTEYINGTPYWLDDWAGALPLEGRILLLVNLGLIILGIGYSWIYANRRAIVPILIASGYLFSVAIARVSGWRFIMPVDWYILIYYSIGSIAIIKILFPRYGNENEFSGNSPVPTVNNAGISSRSKRQLIYTSIVIVVVGLVFPVSERLFSQKYSVLTRQDAIRLYQSVYAANSSMDDMPSPASLASFVEQNNAVMLFGRLLYPRYFRNSASVDFTVIGSQRAHVTIPLATVPSYFPNASDTLVFGCRGVDDSVNAAVVVIFDDEPVIYKRLYYDELLCP